MVCNIKHPMLCPKLGWHKRSSVTPQVQVGLCDLLRIRVIAQLTFLLTDSLYKVSSNCWHERSLTTNVIHVSNNSVDILQ